MKQPKFNPLLPAQYEKKHMAAIQALAKGEATEHQQQLALSWIVKALCMTHDLPFHPDQRLTDFAIGRQFVGKQLIKMTELNIGEVFK